MTYTLIQGDCIETMRGLPANSVQCCVTSPPYYGLRNYEGGDAEIGKESTTDEYVSKLVDVFREVRRLLKDDGTCWINLGDSFASNGPKSNNNGLGASTLTTGTRMERRIEVEQMKGKSLPGVGSNLVNCLERSVKGQPLIFGNAATIGIAAKCGDVPLHDNGFPYGVLFSLLGIERVTIKQRDNDFCQVLHTFASPCYCRITCPIQFVTRNVADLEIVLDAGYHPSIIVTNHDADGQPVLGVGRQSRMGTRKNGNGSLPIEETSEPIAERIIDGQSFGNPVAFYAPLKRFPDIYFVHQAVALRDTLDTSTSDGGNFRITQATEQKLTLALGDCGVDLTAIDVSHLSFLNVFGSVVRYTELYHNAIRKANALQPKQELGIPEMVKRALMEDGWICRSTIIWSKPNPMPESVTDRPTKAHEYIFLLSKSSSYFYDADAVREENQHAEGTGWAKQRARGIEPNVSRDKFANERNDRETVDLMGIDYRTNGRNRRSVWTVATKPYSGAHFATFPPNLIEPCILAGSAVGDTVLDPFNGSGTTGAVALKHGRKYIGCELNADYIELAHERIRRSQPMLFEVSA